MSNRECLIIKGGSDYKKIEEGKIFSKVESSERTRSRWWSRRSRIRLLLNLINAHISICWWNFLRINSTCFAFHISQSTYRIDIYLYEITWQWQPFAYPLSAGKRLSCAICGRIFFIYFHKLRKETKTKDMWKKKRPKISA